MGLARRFVFAVLSLLLLADLLSLALALGFTLTLSQPGQVEGTLKSSGFYNNFADMLINQAQSASNNVGYGQVSFDNTAVRQAARQALSGQLLEQQGDTFLRANYDWLQGKVARPQFTLDLTSARQDFAKRVGQAVASRLGGLPVCNASQLASAAVAAVNDPFSITCRPPTVNAQAAGATISQQVAGSTAFLSNPVITPDNLISGQSQPYYQKLSGLPTAYRLSVKAPYILGAVALVLIVLLFVVARPRRRATRRLGIVLIIAGILLLLNKLVSDLLFNKLQKQTFASGGNGQFQQSAIAVAHRLESQFVKVDMYMGLVLVLIGALLLLALRLRPRTNRADDLAAPYAPLSPTPRPISQPRPGAPAPAQSTNSPPRPKKRPRLIQ